MLEKTRITRIAFTTSAWALVCFSLAYVFHYILQLPNILSFDVCNRHVVMPKNTLFMYPGLGVIIFTFCEIIHTVLFKANYKNHEDEKRAIFVSHLSIDILELILILYMLIGCILALQQISVNSTVFAGCAILLVIILLGFVVGMIVAHCYDMQEEVYDEDEF